MYGCMYVQAHDAHPGAGRGFRQRNGPGASQMSTPGAISYLFVRAAEKEKEKETTRGKEQMVQNTKHKTTTHL